VKRLLIAIVAVSAFIVLAVSFRVYMSYEGIASTDRPSIKVVVTDPSPHALAQQLKSAGVFDPWAAFVFESSVRLNGADKSLHAGTFWLWPESGVREAISTLSQHGREEVTVTFPEGSDLRDVAARLEKAGVIKNPQELYAVTGDPAARETSIAFTSEDFPFIEEKPIGVSLEGYLFPDTYRFFADSSAREVVEKMLGNFRKKTADVRAEAGKRGRDFHDILTLASIVEAEVRAPADRRIVADIFRRRLEEGMALQADSTVHYATGATGSVFTTSEARDSESPWNTYKTRELPPGPIGDPGLDSIEAVLDPTPNDYVYFLTAPDGTVHYAKTLEEHNANKRFLGTGQ